MNGQKERKSVSFPVSVWFSRATGQIHIARPTRKGFSTTVSCDPGHPRGHLHLYRKLAEALAEAGAPAPDLELHVEEGG